MHPATNLPTTPIYSATYLPTYLSTYRPTYLPTYLPNPSLFTCLPSNQYQKLPSVHVLGDFNFKDIDWPHRPSKSDSMLSQSEGQILTDIMNDHGLEQMVHFPTREKNTLDLILCKLIAYLFTSHHSTWSVSRRPLL